MSKSEESKLENTLLSLALDACQGLRKLNINFALAGGIAADLYRGEPRTTKDIDFLVGVGRKNISIAEEFINSLGYSSMIVTEAQLEGNTRFKRQAKRSTPNIVVGRDPEKPYGVDLLLTTLPWGEDALERAQSNLIEIPGLGPLPCLTVEDMIISKLYALKISSSRRYRKSDIPDVVLMIENNEDLDITYLSDVLTRLELVLPKGIEGEANYLLARISKKNRKKNKSLDY